MRFSTWTFFSWISLPHSPEYPISSILFENSRRYLQLKVHRQQICQRYRWQVYRRCPRFTAGKFATCVVDTGGAPWLANISVNFRNFCKWPYCHYCYLQGLGGRCHEITNSLGRSASFSVSPNSNLNCTMYMYYCTVYMRGDDSWFCLEIWRVH